MQSWTKVGPSRLQGIHHSRAFQDKDGSAGETAANKAPHLLQWFGTVTWGADSTGCLLHCVSRESKPAFKVQRA